MNYSQVAKLSRVSPSLEEVKKTMRVLMPTGPLDSSRSLIPCPEKSDSVKVKGSNFHVYLPVTHVPFLHDYTQVSFGWDCAQTLAYSGKEFPLYLTGTDRWIYKAWAYLRFGPAAIGDRAASVIDNAWNLAYNVKLEPSSMAVKALLLCQNATIEETAQDLAMDREVLEAFEVLFFNVIGRKEDLLFLRNLVYPFSRHEEMLPEYSKSGSAHARLIRTGYNSSRKTALLLGGFRTKHALDETVDQASSNFQKTLMQTGALLAASGMLWLDRNHTTISAARNFLQVSKVAGETVGSGDGMISLSQAMRAELDRVSEDTSEELKRIAYGNAGAG